jgi:hypothetical protein
MNELQMGVEEAIKEDQLIQLVQGEDIERSVSDNLKYLDFEERHEGYLGPRRC